MAMFSFDSTSVEAAPAAGDRELLPKGLYPVQITNTEIKQNSKGTGSYLSIEFTVTDGAHARRKVWARLNIRNDNPKAEQIAQSHLASCLKAIGLARINDTAEMHGHQLQVEIEIRRDEKYGDSNEVKRYGKLDAAPAVPMAIVANAKTAAAGGSTAPWAKK